MFKNLANIITLSRIVLAVIIISYVSGAAGSIVCLLSLAPSVDEMLIIIKSKKQSMVFCPKNPK